MLIWVLVSASVPFVVEVVVLGLVDDLILLSPPPAATWSYPDGDLQSCPGVSRSRTPQRASAKVILLKKSSLAVPDQI